MMQHMDLIDLLRALFWTLSCVILAVNNFESLRRRFISYGARSLPPSSTTDGGEKKEKDASPASSSSILDLIGKWDVPHTFFTQFYIFAVTSAFVWGFQLYTRGPLFRAVAGMIDSKNRENSMTANQILLCWILFTVQVCRRLFECLTLTKPSKSRMFIGLWLYGFVYYFAIGLAIWTEGTATLLSSDKPLGNASLSPPSLKTVIGLPIFFVASGIQHDCHCYLASLKKYTLPRHPAFVRVVCPHYTAECAIYLAFSFLAAPPGLIVNKTVFSGLALTLVTLGISAGITKEWYSEKFGKDEVQHKWNMVPFVW